MNTQEISGLKIHNPYPEVVDVFKASLKHEEDKGTKIRLPEVN